MIISNFEQGSPEWHQERVGKATGSNFNKVMTTKLQLSEDGYIYELVEERSTGMVQEGEWQSYHMKRGKELEPEAISAYEFENNVSVQRVGYCTPYAGCAYGCSPDGLIGEDGGLEVKCPATLKKHVEYYDKGKLPTAYKGQVYGFLYVTKRKWIDFMSYHRDYEAFVLRVTTEDEGYIKWRDAFEFVLPEFLEKLEILCARGKSQ